MATWAQTADAVQAAIVAASGLTAAAVRWRYQDAPQPALSFIDLSLGTSLEVGQPFVEDDYDATRAAGAEIRLQVKGIREVPLELEVFTPTTTPDEGSAIALCEQAKSSLWLPTIRDALGALGFVPFDAGPVQFVPAIVAVGFRGRATCTIRCTMPAPIVAEYTTWIETISGTIQGKSTAAPWPVAPAAPTVTPHGTVGTTAYAYKGVAHYPDGTRSGAGAAGSTALGNATLTGTNFNRTAWALPYGCATLGVYRTAGGTTQGLIATLTAPTATLDDTGLTGDGATPPPYDSETAIARDFST